MNSVTKVLEKVWKILYWFLMPEEPDPNQPPMDDNASTPPPADTPPPMDTPPPVYDSSSLPVPGQGKLSEKDDKTFGMLSHLLGIFTGFLGPLIIWLVKKDESPFVDDQGKEALNFQIWMTIGIWASWFLTGLLIGCFTLPVFAVISLVFGIMGTMKANEGMAYRYPVNIRIIT